MYNTLLLITLKIQKDDMERRDENADGIIHSLQKQYFRRIRIIYRKNDIYLSD